MEGEKLRAMQTSRQGRKVAYLFRESGSLSPALLGGKGAGLAELTALGVPVPPGFTITTSVARAFNQHAVVPKRLGHQIRWNIAALEKATGKRFGDAADPLLVSVRSGAVVSMPGMMDTVLNLGLNSEIAEGLGKLTGDRRFALDCYRRFLSMFGDVVQGVPRESFEDILAEVKVKHGLQSDSDMDADVLEEVVKCYRQLIVDFTGDPAIDDPYRQLEMAVTAVLKSWNNPRAKQYRRINNIPETLGTAVNVQSMVYGNRDFRSASGVVFSRNVATGAPGMWGEFLINAQGEDVVAGSRTPESIANMRAWNQVLFDELSNVVRILEEKRKTVVDVEFTVESGELFILQVRAAKLTAEAAITVATHHVWEKKLSKEQALEQVPQEQLQSVSACGFDEAAVQAAMAAGHLLGRGLAASPGSVAGSVVLSSQEAVVAAARGEKVILVRPDTSPDDLEGMLAAVAIVTQTGGATSHAAVVARGLGKPCVVGCRLAVKHGQIISVDGQAGLVFAGSLPLKEQQRKKEINLFLRWHEAALANNWPQPRLDFTTVNESVPVTRLINDFYLADAMCRAAQNSPLRRKCAELRQRIHVATAERLATYLLVACCGELAHANDGHLDLKHIKTYLPFIDKLSADFGFRIADYNDNGARGRHAGITLLSGKTTRQHIAFLSLAADIFAGDWWGIMYGGSAWANIARAAGKFLSGHWPHSVFADHVFDLEHNNGTVFGKHTMIKTDWNLSRLLDAKKEAGDVTSLFTRLTSISLEISTAVKDLYREGLDAGIWSSKTSSGQPGRVLSLAG